MDELERMRRELEEVVRRVSERLLRNRREVASMVARLTEAERQSKQFENTMKSLVSSPALELVADIVRHQDEVRAQVAEILSRSGETQALADMVNRALRDVPAQQLTDLVRLLSGPRVFDERIEEGTVARVEITEEVVEAPRSDSGDGPGPRGIRRLIPESETQLVARLTIVYTIVFLLTGWTLEDMRTWAVSQVRSALPAPDDGDAWELRESKRSAPVRESPGRDSKEITTVEAGDILSVLDGGDRWCRARTLDIQEGWIFRGHLKEPDR